jgi:hypothetical protein
MQGVIGSLMQILGIILGVLFLFLHKWELAAFFIMVHLTGDIIEKLFVMPALAAIEAAAAQFVKLRPFMAMVGMLMMLGYIISGSHALWARMTFGYFGFCILLIGALTYDEVYT